MVTSRGGGVVAVQHVGQRAVAPETSTQVQFDEECGETVEELATPMAEAATDDQLAIREGEVEIAGDDCAGPLLCRIDPGPLDQSDHLDDGGIA